MKKELDLCRQRIAALERELQKSESKWRSVLEWAPQIAISLTPDGKIIFANRHFLDLTGWEFDEIYLKDWYELFLPEEMKKQVRKVLEMTMREKNIGPHSRNQNEILTKDGRRRNISWFNVLTLDDQGDVLEITSLGIDLTAQEEAKAALQVSEERLKLALEAANDAVWDWDVRSGDTFFSNQWFTMLGYTPDELPHSYETFRLLTHEEDIQGVESVVQQMLRDKGSFEYELRMLTKAGDWKWILTRGKVVSPEKSRSSLRVIGTHTDINERKLAEQALKEAKDSAVAANRALRLNMTHLRTLIETMPELVWLKDVNGVYILCNHRFERLYNSQEAEIVGKTDYDFVHKELADFFREKDKAAMAAGKPLVNEERLVYKDDGHTEELETIKTPLYDDRGKLIGVMGVARDITERKRIADELKESELRFKALHNASFGGIAIHDKGIIIDCNQGLADITGYTMEELVGMDGLLLIAESFRKIVMENILAGHEEPYEAMGLRKNGREYPLRLEAKNIPYRGKRVRVTEFRDISHRRQAEEKLRDSELRHRVIFENSPLGMVRISKEGVVLDVNDRLVELIGSSREKLIGLNGLEQNDNKMKAAIEGAIRGKPASYEDYYNPITSSKTIYIHAEFNPVNVGQSPTEVIATLEDFGERKEAQDRLRKAKEEAEAYSRSKTEFLTNMSHEIRTPLNGILGMLQLMQQTGLSDEQSEYVADAIQSSQRLTSLLTDILDLSRVEAGKLAIQHVPFDLHEACGQVIDLYRLTSAQSGVALNRDIDPDIPDIAVGDPIRLQQVLTNLIGNAFKFTKAGHIDLSALLLPPRPSEGCRVLFCVTDTGTGIPDDKQENLFESFTQVSQGYTRQYQGAGLGLAICKQLVQLMNGDIAFESSEGVGTSIYVALPFGESDQEVPIQAAPPRSSGRGKHGKLKILLAEDERVNSLVTRRLLEKAGHSVTVVENGREVLEAVTDNRFDVILMDIQMPIMDGVAATKAIREGAAGEEARNIPIAAVTAYAMVGDREKFLEAGMDGYVVKPIALEKLEDFLGSL